MYASKRIQYSLSDFLLSFFVKKIWYQELHKKYIWIMLWWIFWDYYYKANGRVVGFFAPTQTTWGFARFSDIIFRGSWNILQKHKTLIGGFEGEGVRRAHTIGGSKGGAPGTRPPSPGGPNSFIFMQFPGTKLKNNSTFGSWRPPRGKS